MTWLYEAAGPGHHASQITHCQSDDPALTSHCVAATTRGERERERESIPSQWRQQGTLEGHTGAQNTRTHVSMFQT